MQKLSLAALTIFLLTSPLQSQPTTAPTTPITAHIILIIRHAEKLIDNPTKDPNLSPQGAQRAAALATVLPAHFPHPDFLFATKRSKNSNRPVETIEPLSKALNEPINSAFETADVTGLAKELTDKKYTNKTILIAWHHEKIPDLAAALGVTDAPKSWKGETFDRVWQITYTNGQPTFQDLPEHALPTDTEK